MRSLVIMKYFDRKKELENQLKNLEDEKARVIEYCQKEVSLCDREIESVKRILNVYQNEEEISCKIH